MSPALSSLIVLVLSVLGLAPLALAWLRPRMGPWMIGLYLAAFFAILLTRSDFSVRAPPPEALAGSATPTLTGEDCSEALALADRARIILDRSSPQRLIVQGAVWRQLPEQAREALLGCVAQTWRNRSASLPEVVEQ